MRYDLICEAGRDEAGLTVRGVLRRQRGVSSRLMRRVVHGGGLVHLNGKPARFIDRVAAGDVVGIVFPRENSEIPPQDIPIHVLFEDDDLLAIDKQPGIVVHPTKGHPSGTIANGVVRHMAERGEHYKPRFINRLDMDTSGVLLVGKNAHAQSDFTAGAGKGLSEKRYTAIVEGRVAEASGVVDLPIGLAEDGAVRRVVREDGYPSVTRYRVGERFDAGGLFTLLELELETGRTHQIRVHLAHIGHPVVGDSLYGGAQGLMNRQALHAASLRFRHPSQDREVYVEAPLPGDMQRCLRAIATT
jgi:23S rRNA pseudouridine1911/1915/1917 synthase